MDREVERASGTRPRTAGRRGAAGSGRRRARARDARAARASSCPYVSRHRSTPAGSQYATAACLPPSRQAWPLAKPPCRSYVRAMRPEKLTVKAQEALSAAQGGGAPPRPPGRSTSSTSCSRCSSQERGDRAPDPRQDRRRAVARRLARRGRAAQRAEGGGRRSRTSRTGSRSSSTAPRTRRRS